MEKSELEKLVEEGKNEELTTTILQNTEASKEAGMMLLHLAVKHNNLKLLKYLLDIRFDINAKNIVGHTPFAVAVFYDRFEAMDILLQSNAGIFDADYKGTSTMKILMSKLEKLPKHVVARIVENYKGNKLDSETKAKILLTSGCTLQFVLSVGDDSTTRMFLEKNCKNCIDEFPDAMQFVMEQRDVANVRMLMEYVKSTYADDAIFFKALCRLVNSEESHLFKSAELFLKLSMEWDVIDSNAIQFFESMFAEANKEGLQILLDSNVDVYIRNKFGYEILIALFKNPRVDAEEFLKNRSFLVNAKNTSGCTALREAVENESEKNVRFLLDIGADLNLRTSRQTIDHQDDSKTALCISMTMENNSYIKLLLQYGADIRHLFTEINGIIALLKLGMSSDSMANVMARIAVDGARGVPIKKCYFQHFIIKMCAKQVEDLKKHELTNTVTLFELLTQKTGDISRRLRGKDYLSKLEDYCQKHKVDSFYQSTLKFKLLRASTMHGAKTIFSNIFSDVVSQMTGLPVATDHLVIERIFSFLTYYDMLQLTLSND